MIIEDKLTVIKGKIQNLLEENKRLTSENDQLLKELNGLREGHEQKEKFIKDLENKNLNLQLTTNIENEDKNKLLALIEEYIAEIDKALEILKS
jgi:hypothetical protein